MKKLKLAPWAKLESLEEEAIKYAAEKAGVSPKDAGVFLDDIFRAYRGFMKLRTMPFIRLGNMFNLKPNPNKLRRSIIKSIYLYRAGAFDKNTLVYRIFYKLKILKRLSMEKVLDAETKHFLALEWKNVNEQKFEDCANELRAKIPKKEKQTTYMRLTGEVKEKYKRYIEEVTEKDRARRYRYRKEEGIRKQELYNKKRKANES